MARTDTAESRPRRTKAEAAQADLEKATARHDKAKAKVDRLNEQLGVAKADLIDAEAEVQYRRQSRHLDGGAKVLDEQPVPADS